MDDFIAKFRQYQITWARNVGIGDERRESDVRRPWVLRPEFRERNLYSTEWWSHISGKEHRWARALTSSQCFAVNLFSPLIAQPVAARKVYHELYPHRRLAADDKVGVVLEFTPAGAREWLGERGQPTQVDACFIVTRSGTRIGYGLVEVKLTEQEFGSCRGARADKDARGNPDPARCLDLPGILASPARQCWLAAAEGRTYWEVILSNPAHYHVDVLVRSAGCPFSGGFYQLMRNSVLARCLEAQGGAEWADAGVCLHPANRAVRNWSPAGSAPVDIITEFNRFAPGQSIVDIDPHALARPVQAALTSAATFATGAALPLAMVFIIPRSALILGVSAASLVFLALLGAIGAWAGGANVTKATLRVTFWGALAMALTAGIGAIFGTVV